MRSPQAKLVVGTIVILIFTIGLIILATFRQAEVTCEACVTFHGRTQCRTASGPDRNQATKTAIDNACGFLASGMADSVSCSNTPPDRVTCEPDR